MNLAREAIQKGQSLKKGWCPSAHRPMQSGDGLLLRVRPRVGSLTLDQLIVIAELAEHHGSGHIDLTNRANLQLRGLTPETYSDAIAALITSGIVEADANAEAARNIVVDPRSGLDPDRIDVRSLASELEKILIERRELHALPNKFGFSLSGSSTDVSAHPTADIAITAHETETFELALDGDASLRAVVQTSAVTAAALSLAAVFQELSAVNSDLHRMRDAVSRYGASTIYQKAALTSKATTAKQKNAPAKSYVGLLTRAQAPYAVAIGLPFGRITATTLKDLAKQAIALGCKQSRFSQTRTLIIPIENQTAAEHLLNAAANLNLITRADDPRLMMHVCPGAPSCANATTSTRIDAERLAATLTWPNDDMPSIHISGCEKGCAHRAGTQITFVARNGAYDLIVNGTTQCAPNIAAIPPNALSTALLSLTDPRP